MKQSVNHTELFKNMSNEELLNEYKMRDELLHGEQSCHGKKDVMIFSELCREIDIREE